MTFHKRFYSSISLMVLGAFVFSTCFPLKVMAASHGCVYDEQSPTLDHAVMEFMDPAMFECAEEEILDVLKMTPLSEQSTIARARFLLAGALFGQTLTADISQSLIIEQLVKGFLAEPDWTGTWYFEDMPNFMALLPVARATADSLLTCPFNPEQPSPSHAREIMMRYDLYDCAAAEAVAAINSELAGDAVDSLAVAEGHFVLGQAYYGMKLTGSDMATDSAVIDHLTTGFIFTWEYLGNWLFDDREEFIGLTQEARILAEVERGDRRGGFFRKSTYIVAGIGVAVAGVLVALLVSGDDEPPAVVDTIPSFPPPPGQ